MFDLNADGAALWFDIFNLVLFAGAFAVAVGTWGTIKTAAIKEKFADERIAANEAEAKRAVADSDSAKEGAAKAHKRIAELSAQAEALKKDTAQANARATEAQLALEKFKAPRTLSIWQQQQVSRKLKPFAPRQFDVAMPPGDSEAAELMAILVTTFRDAGWKQVAWKYPSGFQGIMFNTSGFEAVGNATIQGLSIVGPVTDSQAINAVVEALNAEGIPADKHGVEGIKTDNPTIMHVMIGRK